MFEIEFEWEQSKSRSNERKHGVSFEEARTVFGDPLAITISDPKHSQGEQRWLDLGLSANGRLLVVWYTERGGVIRIIGARRASARERNQYENG